MTRFDVVAEVPVDAGAARVFEHGWQSWTPTASYRLAERPHRVLDPNWFVVNYRGPDHAPPAGFHADGLLALDPGDGAPVRIWAAADPTTAVAAIRAELHNGQLRVSADGPVRETVHSGQLSAALGAWAGGYGPGPAEIRPAPTIWCSWYHYFLDVTEADILENLAGLRALDLPVDVVQIDDGYQAELGDWLTLNNRFDSLPGLIGRIRAAGRRAGIWVAPYLVGANSAVARDHPDWLVGSAGGGPVSAGHHWNQDLYALDPTHPGAAAWLTEVFGTFARIGIDFFKLDFSYAGALPGRRHEDLPAVAAYRRGLEVIRAAIGPGGYLLGCGAPILPSIGLVDAMRVGPDIAVEYAPRDGDMSAPGQLPAVANGTARAFQHGRWWVNDPDCLIARPAVERRADWAAHVRRYGGLRGSSDRLSELDSWGLETTRRVLAEVPAPTPFPPD
ncbi:MAG TPA: glycoside hydrolase family 36 protein [Mycobacteriales bacterium]|nr:glycoside hydrolase family 36 protein [Mycobacteriales bacterium]